MRALDLAVLQNGDPTATPPVLSFVAVIALLMGIPCDVQTQSSANNLRTGPRALANLLDSSNIVDEVFEKRIAPGGSLPAGGVQDVSYGIRERTIQITALSIDQTFDRSARAYLELLEDKLALPETCDLLAALGLGMLGWSPITILDPKAFGHTSSAAAIDLHFRFGKRTAGTPKPRIARTTVTGVVDDRDDEPITTVLEP